MSRINLKVCGMRDASNIMEVGALHPDYIGFIFHPSSPRFAGEKFVAPDNLSNNIKRTGVFVNTATKEIIAKIKNTPLDYVQLHGQESVEHVAALKDTGVGVIKVFNVDDSFDFYKTKPYQPYVDYFLFDTKGKYYGGNATAFNWEVLQRYDQYIPFFLSGGINENNTPAIKSLLGMNLHALDINSGVEISPGIKSTEQIKKIQDILNDI